LPSIDFTTSIASSNSQRNSLQLPLLSCWLTSLVLEPDSMLKRRMVNNIVEEDEGDFEEQLRLEALEAQNKTQSEVIEHETRDSDERNLNGTLMRECGF